MTQSRGTGRRRFVLFLFVGALGFIIDSAGTLALSRYLDVSPYIARVGSISLAITITWLLNRFMTFRMSRSPRAGTEYLRYLLVQLSGAGINYCTFALLLWSLPYFHEYPVGAIAIGSMFALAFNDLAMARFVFNRTVERS